ncbi:hypothetical protein STEG23_035622 [Scotinomys teguina]
MFGNSTPPSESETAQKQILSGTRDELSIRTAASIKKSRGGGPGLGDGLTGIHPLQKENRCSNPPSQSHVEMLEDNAPPPPPVTLIQMTPLT